MSTTAQPEEPTEGPWQQGRTLSTPQTQRWDEKTWNENESLERRRVFSNFTSADQGRGRVFIAECRRAEDARFIVEAVNAELTRRAQPVTSGSHSLAIKALRYYRDECSGAEPSISVFHQMLDEALDAQPEPAAPADATEDELLDLEQALERRRILEEIKKVAEVHPADDMPTPFQSAWQQCCEEIFYRATNGQWHMDEDASRFAKSHAAPEPRQPMSACPHGVPHRWSCGECDTGIGGK